VAYVELAALPVTPSWARRHAMAVLGAWQVPPEIIETAVLLISEIVSNAVAATTRPAREPAIEGTGRIVHTLCRQPGQVLIEVTDSDPRPPVLTEADADDETGRGLMLVQALSKEWGHYFPPTGGKTVFATLDVPA
jgi:anti-sigma regulatory factor (Ser/Thr protein kinase)